MVHIKVRCNIHILLGLLIIHKGQGESRLDCLQRLSLGNLDGLGRANPRVEHGLVLLRAKSCDGRNSMSAKFLGDRSSDKNVVVDTLSPNGWHRVGKGIDGSAGQKNGRGE